jgi:hypothetical protein
MFGIVRQARCVRSLCLHYRHGSMVGKVLPVLHTCSCSLIAGGSACGATTQMLQIAKDLQPITLPN